MNIMFFKAVVTSAALSGMEPLVLSEAQMEKLESAHVGFMRKLFGRDGFGKVKDQEKANSVSHEKIRKNYLKEHDLYEEAAITVRDKARQGRHLLPASIVVAFYVLASKRGWPARKIDFFLDKIYIGASLEPDDVCLSFRNQLSAREFKRRGANQQRYLLNAFIKCFNTNASRTPTKRFCAPQEGSSLYQIKKYSPILEMPS